MSDQPKPPPVPSRIRSAQSLSLKHRPAPVTVKKAPWEDEKND